jgi:tetratricopeptide (TPR) repeat protein
MPRAVILTSHPDDYQAVCTHLTELEEETHPQGTVYEVGRFSENEQIWEVAITEIDNINAVAASETERAISHFQPDIIVLVSAATGIKDVSLGDVVVATKVYGYESAKAERKLLPRPEALQPSYQLHMRAKVERRNADWLNRLSGDTSVTQPSVLLAPIASGSQEVADSQADLIEFLRSHYSDSVAIDNLGFGFLEAAKANESVSALAVCGISCLLDDMENASSSNRFELLQGACAFIFEVLAKHKIIDKSINTKTQNIQTYSMPPEALLVEVGQRIEGAFNNKSDRITNDHENRVNYARTLINQGNLSQAVSYLEDLKLEIWHHTSQIVKYLLLSKLSMAKIGLGEIKTAGKLMIEALQYNSEDDKAISFAAMGYVFHRDFINAEQLVCKALEKNPANSIAHSLRIRMVSSTEPIELALKKVPTIYHEDLDVLIALGEVALNRDLYQKAQEWLQAALTNQNVAAGNDAGMKSVKAALALAFMQPILEQYPLIAYGQLKDEHKLELEQAVSLFNEILGGEFVNPNDLSYLDFTTLANRGVALRLLRRYDEAIRDIDIALYKEPKDSNLIKQRALLAHEKGNEAEALDYAQKILASPETPEASLLAASSLIALRREKEAEDILNTFLTTDSPEDLKQEAKCILFNLFLERDDKQSAEAILQQIINEAPDSVFTYIQRIRWQRYLGTEKDLLSLLEEAKALLTSKSSLPAQIILADTLFAWNYYRDAAEVYAQFVDISLYSPLTDRLLKAYYFSGNYRQALDLCEQLLNKYGPLATISHMTAYIYSSIVSDMERAKLICEEYLIEFPHDSEIRLRLASINYHTGNFADLDVFLDSKPVTSTLNIASLKILAQLYKVRNRIAEFIDTVYQVRRYFYAEEQSHVFYVISYLEATKIQSPNQNFHTVEEGCGILLKNTVGKEEWFIIEDHQGSSSSEGEINSIHPLYQLLIGKRIDEEIVLREDEFGRNSFQITAITDKYFAAGKQSMLKLENQTDLANFRMVAVPADEETFASDWVPKFIEGLQKQQDNFKHIKSIYIEGQIPFGSFAKIAHRNPIELWQILAFEPSPFLHAWSDFKHERFESALLQLQKGGIIIIDPISLLTLHHLGIVDSVVEILGKFGISQSSLDLFQAMVETKQGFQKQGFTCIGVENGYGILHDIPAEQIAYEKEFFEKIVAWIRNNCLVLPCYRALNINKDTKENLMEIIDQAFLDTVLLAGESGRILYSDDQWLRYYSRAESGATGVWTQAVLYYCFMQASINKGLYYQKTLELASRGYTYTIIDSDGLIESVKLHLWKVNPLYTSALRTLASRHTTQNYMLSTVVDFLYRLYLEIIVTDSHCIDPRDELVFELLKLLTENHSATNFIENLKKSIRAKFDLIPLQKNRVLMVIEAWKSSQLLVT